MTGTTVALRPPRQHVDPRCPIWWTAQYASMFAVPVVVLIILGVLIEPARAWLLVPAALLLVIGIVVTLFVPRLRFRIHRWEATEDAVYTRSGWLFQEWRAAPLSRVQTVDLARGPMQRAFGLASVTVTTASSKGPVVIEALDHQEAEDLVQRLTTLTQAEDRDEDAT